MNNQFEIAGGSIIGRDHVSKEQNNHDAYEFLSTKNGIVAVVCDGCGSGEHSEIGAKIGARLITHELARQLSRDDLDLHRLKTVLTSNISVIANAMGYRLSEIISNHFLFTVMCAVITDDWVHVITFGDGTYIVDGEIHNIDYSNIPPYVAYNITGSSRFTEKPELADFRTPYKIPTSLVNSLVIGSDGLLDLIKAKNKQIPGKKQEVGHISQFWTDDKYFSNEYAITRKLRLINKTSTKIDYEERKANRQSGLLHDDTTFIVIRRKT